VFYSAGNECPDGFTLHDTADVAPLGQVEENDGE